MSYQEETLTKILKDVKVRCIKCHAPMIRVFDWFDEEFVGYSCTECSHYNLTSS